MFSVLGSAPERSLDDAAGKLLDAASRSRSNASRIRRPKRARDSSPSSGTFFRRSSGSGRIWNAFSVWYTPRTFACRVYPSPPTWRIVFSDFRFPRGRIHRRSRVGVASTAYPALATAGPKAIATPESRPRSRSATARTAKRLLEPPLCVPTGTAGRNLDRDGTSQVSHRVPIVPRPPQPSSRYSAELASCCQSTRASTR